MNNQARLIKLGIASAAVLVVIIFFSPFYQVSSGYIGVKTIWSAVQKETLLPGLHVYLPVMESVHEISIQPRTTITSETAATHDQQNVTTKTAVTWSAQPAFADEVYANFRSTSNMEQTIIAPIVANDLKAIIAQYDAQELITKRTEVATKIEQLIFGDLAKHHILVNVGGVNLTDLEFSEQYDHAIEEKQIAQQKALQARYTLEQTQTSSQAQVVQAKAAAEANVATAEGVAKATLVQAQADAEAYREKQAALTPMLLQLTALQKWNGILPTYMGGGQPIPMLSLPSGPTTH